MASTRRNGKDIRERRPGFFADAIISRILETDRDIPVPKILQVGLINANTTYELGCAKVPDSDESFYTVRIASHQSNNKPEALRMSGVFSTRHDAQSYISYLRTQEGRLQKI